jgi:phosphoribosylanthranilate isomerase
MTAKPASPNLCRIKVCGIRDAAEAAALDALGVDWIGFNFHPGSPRFITPEDAAPIVRSLKRSVPVGVFVDADPARVRAVAAVSGIRMAQLHGAETWDTVARMPIPVIKAVPHTGLADLGGIRPGLDASASPAPLAYLMVDTQARAKPGGAGFGGTGEAFDWSLLERHPLPLPFFLAGGLGPHNLADAVAAARPFAVDLNSKVETAPGRKDLAKIEACIAILKKLI